MTRARRWLRTYRDEIAVIVISITLVVSVAWATHTGQRERTSRRIERRIERLESERDYYRDAIDALSGAELWAHEYDGGAIVFAEWRFADREGADEFLMDAGGTIDELRSTRHTTGR